MISRGVTRPEKLGAIGVDQVHRSLGDLVFGEEIVLTAGDDVDNRIADTQNVELAHEFPLSGERLITGLADTRMIENTNQRGAGHGDHAPGLSADNRLSS